MKIFNDIHLSAARKTGTTQTSAAALKQFTFDSFEALLTLAGDDHVVINGDLFDAFDVDGADFIQAYTIIANWLVESAAQARRLTLICGNHDWSPKAGRVSAFHLLTHFLNARFGGRVQVIDFQSGFTRVWGEDNVFAIPHMPNQDLFDLELAKVEPASGPAYLLLHANYDNNFAVEADHSLNVSADQAEALIEMGWMLVFGHEHQTKQAKGGKVVIVGNQFPTSVADCLDCTEKLYASIENNTLELHQNIAIDTIFSRVDWRELADDPGTPFIRVTGSAAAEEAADVVDAVALFRQKSSALVVTNAVKVEGMAEFDKLAEMSFESVSAFNVLEALLLELTEEEGAKVKELLE
ncbi:MAG: metallophosphoesterase [Candidatus Paceibacterota bacterium]|jgi:hypothetical protein